MNSTTKHTPTPWIQIGSGIHINGDEQYKIADASWLTADKASNEANAAFIVRACNAHDKLVEACKLAQAALEELGFSGPSHTMAALREAVTLAEGGKGV